MSTQAEQGPEELASWTSLLHVMPIPAALIDTAGVVLAASRWFDSVDIGDQLLQPNSPNATLRLGVHGTRWRVRPVDDDESVFLATGEREDVGDHLLRKFFSSGDSLFVIYDQAGRIIESNAAWELVLGYTSDELFGVDSWTFLPADDLKTRASAERELRETGRSDPTFKMRTADGNYRLVQWNIHFDSSVGRAFAIGRDVTEEDRATSELQRRADTDPLTGLSNRTQLTDRLTGLLGSGQQPALLYLDLDQFKVVNDSLGHSAGDLLLAKLARRLATARVGGDLLVARFGGDEFVVLLDNADSARAIHVADTLIRSLKRPFTVANRSIHASMSIGIALTSSTSSRRASDLLSNADTAVYEAKRRGRGIAVLFDEQLRAATARRFEVEEGLRSALENNAIEAWYQPLVNLETGSIVGAEALVRWRDGDTVRSPGEFLDIAEEASLMTDIGSQMSALALTVAAPLIERDPNFIMSINVSHNELVAAGFVSQLTMNATSANVSAQNVLVEITEQTAIEATCALPVLNELRDLGYRIALDDFGTGYSSLAHLRVLPIDVVKIDRSFIEAMNDDPLTKSLTKTLIDLGRTLELEIVMEGIETEAQSATALELGGNIAQGYLFYRPMPAAELLSLMENDAHGEVAAAA